MGEFVESHHCWDFFAGRFEELWEHIESAITSGVLTATGDAEVPWITSIVAEHASYAHVWHREHQPTWTRTTTITL